MQSRATVVELDNGLSDVRHKPRGKEVRNRHQGRKQRERRRTLIRLFLSARLGPQENLEMTKFYKQGLHL